MANNTIADDTAVDGTAFDDVDTDDLSADIDDLSADTDSDAGDDTADGKSSTVTVKRRSPAGRTAAPRRRVPRETAHDTSRGGRGRRWLIALGPLVAVLIGSTAFFGYHYFTGSRGADTPAARSAVVGVAKDYAVKLSSFDYRDLNKNRAAITAMSTDDFGKKYDEMVKALTEIVSNGKGIATAEVSYSAVESISRDKATVILFVDQKARNVVAPNGKNQPYRMVVKLVRADGRWLVDDVQTV
ncbi:hypothetical protein [Gordonia crocea]|uniref:Mce associated membrane protein n=1 Tax=Gordonia crocea TaxID=589162 RepID=A0A7I9UYB1_9ACTN|nr:hypothetical protein [Gordonia crocea]GED97801.1 hypothetical protein nbrc107697_18400 [Gordonia crocea]